jgi:hypothetical protein
MDPETTVRTRDGEIRVGICGRTETATWRFGGTYVPAPGATG